MRIASVYEVEFEWDEDTASKVKDFEGAKDALHEEIEALLKATGTQHGRLCFSSKPNWREDVLPSYKQNRTKPKPELVEELTAYAREHFDVVERPRLEADDVMGILGTLSPDKYILASVDKDLMQIPGIHYNWNTDEMIEVSEKEADYFFYLQVLTGDPTDGYKGCPGIGPKSAERILADAEDPWRAIVETYESKGLTEEDALVQARVARILRKEDYDYKKKQPRLWTPK